LIGDSDLDIRVSFGSLALGTLSAPHSLEIIDELAHQFYAPRDTVSGLIDARGIDEVRMQLLDDPGIALLDDVERLLKVFYRRSVERLRSGEAGRGPDEAELRGFDQLLVLLIDVLQPDPDLAHAVLEEHLLYLRNIFQLGFRQLFVEPHQEL
jgi:hypothetical protein